MGCVGLLHESDKKFTEDMHSSVTELAKETGTEHCVVNIRSESMG